MKTQIDTETETSTGTVWPPMAHLFRGKGPCKEGDYALCGKKLMGIDLNGTYCPKICPKCEEIALRVSS